MTEPTGLETANSIEERARQRAMMLFEMDDTVGGPHPRAPGAVEKLAAEIAASIRAAGNFTD